VRTRASFMGHVVDADTGKRSDTGYGAASAARSRATRCAAQGSRFVTSALTPQMGVTTFRYPQTVDDSPQQ
jgi:hypothetical protein